MRRNWEGFGFEAERVVVESRHHAVILSACSVERERLERDRWAAPHWQLPHLRRTEVAAGASPQVCRHLLSLSATKSLGYDNGEGEKHKQKRRPWGRSAIQEVRSSQVQAPSARPADSSSSTSRLIVLDKHATTIDGSVDLALKKVERSMEVPLSSLERVSEADSEDFPGEADDKDSLLARLQSFCLKMDTKEFWSFVTSKKELDLLREKMHLALVGYVDRCWWRRRTPSKRVSVRG
ncbi:hypothetical protein CRG98_037011 [Punica granatum]|uniref:Uncharacterized protein n=1 Tax=Punica granatum TaxID=22663 RepID=A0A2I0IF27_PUNGR|nr:hypothetical protein CRG98_037011 [Punica granatum]